MTFTARPIAPFKIDILSASDPSSFAAGQKIPCTGTPTNTGATVSSGQITISAGSHWRIEYSANFLGGSVGECQFEIGLYSITDSQYIGHSLWGSGENQNPTRMGRVVATALVLNSEISTSKVIEARIISQVQMSSSSAINYVGKPGFRIMELPA